MNLFIASLLVIVAKVSAQNPSDFNNFPFFDTDSPLDISSTVPPTGISNLFRIPTIIFNAFPNTNVTASVLFERDRVSRIQYGEKYYFNATFTPLSDFIIQFRQGITDDIQEGFTDFGFTESELPQKSEVILLIRRDSEDIKRPRHNLLVFDLSTVSVDSSRLYIYNAIWNKRNRNQGLYFYGLFLRRNSDGSESESIAQLAVDIQMNSGIEINVQPNRRIDIRAFYSPVSSVPDFKSTPYIVRYNDFIAIEGKREFLLAYGDYNTESNPTGARLVMLDRMSTSKASHLKNIFILNCAIITVIILLVI